MTPDLLKGQQELSQQTHEETAKQILFSYLKDGSVFSFRIFLCNPAQLNPDQSTNLMLHRNSHVSWRKRMFCWSSVFSSLTVWDKKVKECAFLTLPPKPWVIQLSGSCFLAQSHVPCFFSPREMTVTLSVCGTNQRLTDSQRKVCWVKRWPVAPLL